MIHYWLKIRIYRILRRHAQGSPIVFCCYNLLEHIKNWPGAQGEQQAHLKAGMISNVREIERLDAIQ